MFQVLYKHFNSRQPVISFLSFSTKRYHHACGTLLDLTTGSRIVIVAGGCFVYPKNAKCNLQSIEYLNLDTDQEWKTQNIEMHDFGIWTSTRTIWTSVVSHDGHALFIISKGGVYKVQCENGSHCSTQNFEELGHYSQGKYSGNLAHAMLVPDYLTNCHN